MADPLFEIGNHAEAHRNLRLLTGNALIEEIEGPQRAYEMQRAAFRGDQCVREDAAFETIPPRMGLFRFPFRRLQSVGSRCRERRRFTRDSVGFVDG